MQYIVLKKYKLIYFVHSLNVFFKNFLMSKSKSSNETLVKLGLAALLLICLFPLPYGYYSLIRFIAVVCFALLAYFANEGRNIPMVIIYVALAFLFQPFAKVELNRQIWGIVDVVVAVGLVVMVFARKK
jgi:hypothetical protein